MANHNHLIIHDQFPTPCKTFQATFLKQTLTNCYSGVTLKNQQQNPLFFLSIWYNFCQETVKTSLMCFRDVKKSADSPFKSLSVLAGAVIELSEVHRGGLNMVS